MKKLVTSPIRESAHSIFLDRNFMAEKTASTAALSRLGLKAFRPGQEEVIEAVLDGKDVMCVMPTGGGKSLCYQLPSLVRPGLTIVISPLIALMKDQVDTLKSLGIRAELINSSLTTSEQADVMQKMRANSLDLVYVAPERLRNGRFIDTINQCTVDLLAVDEAHCVSEWGHDFRPDYARLGQFRNRYLNKVQTIALTATATPAVRNDISELLHLRNPDIFVTGFSRDNLRFTVKHCSSEKDKNDSLHQYLATQSGSGIIYAATRKRCEELAESISQAMDIQVGVYHAGLDSISRQQTQERFMGGDLSAIVATNAFGMGIDKSDIRFVVHYNMPGSLEAYYQEAGRAGRDGKPSECLLLFSYSDRYIQEFFIENRYPSRDTVHQVYNFLQSRVEDPIELTLEEVRELIGTKDSSEAISTAEQLIAKTGVLKRLDSSSNQAVLRIDSELPTLLDLVPVEAKIRRKVLQAVELIVGNRRGEDVYVTPNWLAKNANVEKAQLSRSLRELCKLRAFDYVPPFRGRGIHFLDRTKTFDQLEIDFEQLSIRKTGEYEKLESVIQFARNTKCRQKTILQYFGEEDPQECDRCDRCSPVASDPNHKKQAIALDRDHYFVRGLQIVMSGVTRMHGRFGKNMVAQMLCGSKNKKLSQWKLHQLSTYGLLSGMKHSEVAVIMDRLSEFGLVVQQEIEQRRPTIHMTELGRDIMHGRTDLPSGFSLDTALAKKLIATTKKIEPLEAEQGRESKNQALAQTTSIISESPSTTAIDQDLIDALKRWRRKTSAALGIPAFRVLTNATLETIAVEQPQSTQALKSIKGIGDATIAQFAEDIIHVIQSAFKTKEQSTGVLTQVSFSESIENAERNLRQRPSNSLGLDTELRGVDANPPKKPDIENTGGKTSTSPPPIIADQSWVGSESYWTWRLVEAGFTASEIIVIRKFTSEELENHLRQAKESGF